MKTIKKTLALSLVILTSSISEYFSTPPSQPPLTHTQEIPERLLFTLQNLKDMRLVSQCIYDLTHSTDILFFVGRSPLYFSKQIKSFPPKGIIFETPFSHKGFNFDVLEINQQKSYKNAQESYRNYLKYHYSKKINKSGRILVIDRYESGKSINEFCDLLESALGVKTKIIALCDKSDANSQAIASKDPRVLNTILIPSELIIKLVTKEDLSTFDFSPGRRFPWTEWIHWEKFMNEKISIGNVAAARLAQIHNFQKFH